MTEPDAYQANIQRGAQLIQLNRPGEAAKYFQEAIAVNPRSAHAFAQLARCWNDIPSERHKVIPAIDQAIAFSPTTSVYFGLKAWLLVRRDKERDALAVALQGINLNPTCVLSLTALACALTKLREWSRAEAACRRILALNPNDVDSLNLLAQALRNQNRRKESKEVVARILAEMPNNSFGHANAGYSALQAGDHFRANQHFLEALRLDPHFNFARAGLVESLRKRTSFVHYTLRLAEAIGAPDVYPKWIPVVLFGLLNAGVAIVGPIVDPETSFEGVDFFAVLFSLPLIYWLFGQYVKFVADFLLLFHPIARRAMTQKERRWPVMVLLALAAGLSVLLYFRQWSIAGTVVAFTCFLALIIQIPVWYDAVTRQRLERLKD